MSVFYDITPPLGPGAPTWPSDPPVVFAPFKSVAAGSSSNVTSISFGSHAGCHVDAPSHIYPNGMTVDEIPPDVLIGPARVVEFLDEKIDLAAVKERLGGRKIDRLLLKTKNSGFWSIPGFTADFVGVTADAATYILELGVKVVGIDYLSIEAAHGAGAPVHRALLERNVVIIESLNLSGVPTGDYELICLPLKLSGLDGAPARVVLRR